MTVRLIGGIDALRQFCNPHLQWIRVITPDFDIYLVPDDMDGDDGGFSQLSAATWGLNRDGANDRRSSGCGATIVVLDTGVRVSHQEVFWSSRAIFGHCVR